jgi:hypothetical protein
MQPLTQTNKRIAFIDQLRAFMFMLLAFDHTVHAYALHFGKYHFFKDYDRSLFGDMIYMHNNSVIMPMLFFIFGLFVLPAYQQKGGWIYLKERFFKLGIPYLIGIPFIVPLLVFPRYLFNENPVSGYWEFWREVYFAEKLQGGGPFWVLYCLALYSTILILFNRLFPFLMPTLGRFMQLMTKHPAVSIPAFIILGMCILGLSDLRWGAPWWIGFGHLETHGETFWIIVDKIINLFHLQGSRFLLHGLYFLMGAMVSASRLLYDHTFWEKLSAHWPLWLIGMITAGIAYIGYSLTHIHDGAYNDDIHRFLDAGGSWREAVPLIIDHGMGVLIRTSLHSVFVFFQVMTLLSIFYRFFNRMTPFWHALASCSYGIFLLHEIPVIWLQYALNGYALPIPVKVFIIFIFGFGGTWGIVYALRKLPGVSKVI